MQAIHQPSVLSIFQQILLWYNYCYCNKLVEISLLCICITVTCVSDIIRDTR